MDPLFISITTLTWAILHGLTFCLHHWFSCGVWKWGKEVAMEKWPPLPDIFHRNNPPKKWMAPRLYKPFAYIQSGICAVPLLLLMAQSVGRSWTTWVETYRLLAACHIPLMLCRMVCFSVTLLPDVTQEFKIPKLMHGATYDLIYSGHVVFALLPTFASIYLRDKIPGEKPYSTFPLLLLYATLNLANIAGIVWCRRHYTVDVWLALVITFLFFYFATTAPGYVSLWKIT